VNEVLRLPASNEPAVLEGLGVLGDERMLSCGVGERCAGSPTCQRQRPIASPITFWVCPSFTAARVRQLAQRLSYCTKHLPMEACFVARI
jgi:hypothetical protein